MDDTISAVCICVSFVPCLCCSLCLAVCTRALNFAVGLPVGNTCSVLVPAGPGGMELHQSHLDWATGSATHNNFAYSFVCGAAGNR